MWSSTKEKYVKKNKEKLLKEIRLLKKRIKELTIQKDLSENILDGARDPLIVLDGDLRVLAANNSFYDTFRVNPKETIGKLIYDLGNKQWNIPELRTLLESIIPYQSSFDNFLVKHTFSTIGERLIVLNARRIPRAPEKPKKILLAMEDITEIDKIKLIFDKMAEKEFFSKIARSGKEEIVNLKNEVNALRIRLSENIKYKILAKES